jgi:small subunit ribosomal protein S6
MRNYEIAVVLHPDLEIDLATTLDKVEGIITKNGGKITKKDNWGKRKLAYKIKKQDWGIYVFYNVEIDASKINKINQTLRITEEVLRYLIVSIDNIRYLNKPTKVVKAKTKVAKKETKSEDKE